MPQWTDSHGCITLDIEQEDAESCSHPGECFSDVLALSKKLYIKQQVESIKPTVIATTLKGYGAWTDKELRDRRENIIRLLWLAAGDIVEETRNADQE